MTSSYIFIPSNAAKLLNNYSAKAFWLCPLVCLIALSTALGNVIEAVPGQSIEGQLDLVVDKLPGHHITITPPSAISGWQFQPDATNELLAVFNVKANKDGWQVAVKDSDLATSGHMTEWTGSDYKSLKLSNPMRVKAAYEVALPEGGMIQTGSKTAGQGQDIVVTFLQDSTFEDEPLPEGHVYRIVITFIGSYTQ